MCKLQNLNRARARSSRASLRLMSAVTDSAITRLESVLGANAIFVAKAANRELYAIDGIAPTAFAKPASAEQAGEIVRFAAKENLSIIPVGARSKLFCAPTPHALRRRARHDRARRNRPLRSRRSHRQRRRRHVPRKTQREAARAQSISPAPRSLLRAVHHRRRHRRRPRFAAAQRLRHPARFPARRRIHRRQRRTNQNRRPRRKKRHRLRPPQTPHRLLRHTRRHHPPQFPHFPDSRRDARLPRRISQLTKPPSPPATKSSILR